MWSDQLSLQSRIRPRRYLALVKEGTGLLFINTCGECYHRE